MSARAITSRLGRVQTRITRQAGELAAAAERRRLDEQMELGRLIMGDPVAREIAIDFSNALRPHANRGEEWVTTDPAAVRLGERLIERVAELGGRI